MNQPTVTTPELPWMVRHEFLLRRLHSLSGLIPVGAYMVIHLLTNATVLDSPAAFQDKVYLIHSLGSVLWIVEWGFIFLPLLFHAIFGIIIIRGGLPNTGNYPYAKNYRYTLQRVSGMIAFVFIMWHVFHMHGWFHADLWHEKVSGPLNGARFRPYNAASSLTLALQGVLVPVLYAIGVLACVFHLANGLWTMGITWGLWISKAAQRRADWACTAFGIGLALVGLSALVGGRSVPLRKAYESEEMMYSAREAGQLVDKERAAPKRWSDDERKMVEQEIANREKVNAAAETTNEDASKTAPTSTP